MRFLPDWRQAWRWWSVRVSAIGVLFGTLMLAAPDAVLQILPHLPADLLPAQALAALHLVLSAAAIVARVIQQRREVPDGNAD